MLDQITSFPLICFFGLLHIYLMTYLFAAYIATVVLLRRTEQIQYLSGFMGIRNSDAIRCIWDVVIRLVFVDVLHKQTYT